MWVAKVSFDGSKALIGSKTLKHKINIFTFPLSFHYDKNAVIVNITGNIFGENVKEFVKDLKKEDRVLNFELNNDFFIGTLKEPLFSKAIYNKDLIHLIPVLIDEKGQEHVTVGSFNRKSMEKAFKSIKSKYEAKLHSIKEQKIRNISVVQRNPELTSKQKNALELAIKNGYYEYPRGIGLEKLAKLMKISYSTYQAHLRKAEQKLLPFFFEQTK